jgi:hypothetical protein
MNDFEEPIVDHHDGVKYTFETGRPVKIPLAAAEHIFGFQDGKASFVHTQRRWGWNVKDINLKNARDWFSNIIIESVVMKQFEASPDVSEQDFADALSLVTARELPPDIGIRRVHE